MSAAVPGWLTDPSLAPLWLAARERLERNGIEATGTIRLIGLDRAARHALSGLLGRPVIRDTVRIDLAALDVSLRERSGIGGLVAVLERLHGRSLHNRRADRSTQAAAREGPFVAARSWLASRPDLTSTSWVEPWLADVRRSGALARHRDAEPASGTVVMALSVLSALAEQHVVASTVSRTELGAQVVGDAHALDEGTLLSHLVLRALAAQADSPLPAGLADRRALWENAGVLADRVSSTCLVLGLRPIGESGVARRLRAAADAGDPVHLTAWDLARDALEVRPGIPVLVCENPRVLEAAAESRGGEMAVLCTSGMPGLAAVDALQRLARSGADLCYHGDFDWPGIAIANRLRATIGCRPWLMSAADYLAAARGSGLALEGRAAEPSWDAALGAAMRDRGVAVHEEAVLAQILASLPPGPAGRAAGRPTPQGHLGPGRRTAAWTAALPAHPPEVRETPMPDLPQEAPP